ncbi:MAG: hypothetical protein LBK46_00580 [Oscillospiraceae bacterium]|jgi:hypothetical protein|nr:hypothetical protein [Oscillospiraceae bacterium]
MINDKWRLITDPELVDLALKHGEIRTQVHTSPDEHYVVRFYTKKSWMKGNGSYFLRLTFPKNDELAQKLMEGSKASS